MSADKGGGLLLNKRPPDIMNKTQKKIKSLKTKCDRLWSEAVRTRDGECILCGRKDTLQAHHWIHSRAQGNLHRWNVKNGVTLCYGCHLHKVHIYASASILDELKKAALDRGIVTPEELEAISNSHEIAKFGVEDMERIKDYLNDYLERLDPNFYAVGGTNDEE